MTSLSVIIITKNEAKNIVSCLESVKFANEIIILDSGSTDDTIKLAKVFTEKIFTTDWPGFGRQKNRALEKCCSEWVLSIDADEVVSPTLQNEITRILQSENTYDAFLIPRKSIYCNQLLNYGDWRKDNCLRLFKRHRGKFTEVSIHEKVLVAGTIGKLKGHLLHDSFSNLEDVLSKMNHYSTLSAHHKFSNGRKSSLFTAISHSLWTFFRGYILRLGFLDGKKGFMLAVSNAEGCYYRYLKMLLLAEESLR